MICYIMRSVSSFLFQTNRHIRLREVMLEHSRDATLIVMYVFCLFL